jgi:hypothetical protein
MNRRVALTFRPSWPSYRQLLAAPCLVLLLLAAAALCASTARAAHYKMVACAAENGAQAYASATSDSGSFEIHNYCSGASGEPPGEAGYLRINESQSSGSAPQGAYASVSWTAPSSVSILTVGAYTREHYDFNEGWRAPWSLCTRRRRRGPLKLRWRPSVGCFRPVISRSRM